MAAIAVGEFKRADHLQENDWVLHGQGVFRITNVDNGTLGREQRSCTTVDAEIIDHSTGEVRTAQWIVGPATEYRALHII